MDSEDAGVSTGVFLRACVAAKLEPRRSGTYHRRFTRILSMIAIAGDTRVS